MFSLTPGDAGRVDLEHLQRIGLQELLEHDAVGHVLAGRDRDRRDGPRDRGVGEHVIRVRRLFDPGDVERRELRHPVDRVRDVPALVGVDGDPDVGADGRARDAETSDVVGEVAADLELDLVEARVDRLAAQAGELGVVVAEPARRRRVGGIAGCEQLGFALGLAELGGAEQLERLVAGERVAQVAEVDEFDDLLGAHPREQLPERQAGPLRLEVPHRVDDRADRHVHDALLGAEPAQLRVVDELAGERAHRVEDRLDLAADEVRGDRLDRGELHLVAAADREDEAVALVAVVGIGDDAQVGRRVVGVRVHGVGAVQEHRCLETDIARLDCDDRAHGTSLGCEHDPKHRMSRTSIPSSARRNAR